jgi:hypothetical protein
MAIIKWAKSRQTPTRSVRVSSAEVFELLVLPGRRLAGGPSLDRFDATIALGQVAEFLHGEQAEAV